MTTKTDSTTSAKQAPAELDDQALDRATGGAEVLASPSTSQDTEKKFFNGVITRISQG